MNENQTPLPRTSVYIPLIIQDIVQTPKAFLRMNSIFAFVFLLFASAASMAFAQDAGEELSSFHTVPAALTVACDSTIDMFLRPLTEAEEDFLGYCMEDAYKMVHKRFDGATLENMKYMGKRGETSNDETVEDDLPASFLRAIGFGRRLQRGYIYMGGVYCSLCPDDDDLGTSVGDIIGSSVTHHAWEKILAITLAAGPFDIFKGVTSCTVDVTYNRFKEGSE